MIAQTTEKPRWAVLTDYAMDCTDAYAEITDPEGEFGETCEALFVFDTVEDYPANPYDKCQWVNVAQLVGLVVQDGYGPSYVPLDRVRDMLGAEFIGRIEAAANEDL